jgi:hypothetical protein
LIAATEAPGTNKAPLVARVFSKKFLLFMIKCFNLNQFND